VAVNIGTYGGYRIIVHRPAPKIQLKPDLCSESFTEHMNIWLLMNFGFGEGLVKPGEIVIDKINRIMYCHPNDADQLRNGLVVGTR
jgi:hypothetical protein